MVKLYFEVNENGVEYFRGRLKKTTPMFFSLRDAESMRLRLETAWNEIQSDVNGILERFFQYSESSLTVEAYPEYFFLWAIHPDGGILVLWQPSRSEHFYGGLILHELVHFALKDFGLNKFVEETVCFLFERMFILDADGIELEDFEYEKGTDDFHRRAIACSRDFYEDFLVFFANGDRDGLLRYLDEKIDTDAKRATITRSLTDYLATNG